MVGQAELPCSDGYSVYRLAIGASLTLHSRCQAAACTAPCSKAAPLTAISLGMMSTADDQDVCFLYREYNRETPRELSTRCLVSDPAPIHYESRVPKRCGARRVATGANYNYTGMPLKARAHRFPKDLVPIMSRDYLVLPCPAAHHSSRRSRPGSLVTRTHEPLPTSLSYELAVVRPPAWVSIWT